MEKLPSSLCYKIGALSELTGIPVTTIRDWENRYQALTPTKTDGKHRVYSQSDVERASLFKLLSEHGQSISTVAKLTNNELQNLLRKYRLAELSNSTALPRNEARLVAQLMNVQQNENLSEKRTEETTPVKATVVGLALASRLNGSKFVQALTRAKLQIEIIYSDLQEAVSQGSAKTAATIAQDAPSQLLVVSQNTLHQESAESICRLASSQHYQRVIVLYQFAPTITTEFLRRNGMVPKREPLTEPELAELISAVMFGNEEQSVRVPSTLSNDDLSQPLGLALIPPRKYSDESLLKIASISTNIFCECPKHVSEILTQLAGFEKYSQDCQSQSQGDKEMHGYLSIVSGTARALFELALERLAAHEGFTLEP